MDYENTYPAVYIQYYRRGMVLHVDNDASYLVDPREQSRIAGYYYLFNHLTATKHPRLSGSILVECKTLRYAVSSAAELEVAGFLYNAQMTISTRIILEATDHPQPPTPIKMNISTAIGFIHNNIHQKNLSNGT